MTSNLDIQLGMGRRNGEHMLVADNVPGVGQLSVSINTQQLHELAQTAQHASLEAKGYEELRVKSEDLQVGDSMVSLCGAQVTDRLTHDPLINFGFSDGTRLSIHKDKDVRIIRAIQ